MNKDPAFLFYSSDFLVGTMLMSYEEIGKYIKLLAYIHSKGGIISTKEFFQVCNEDDTEVINKFSVDGEGNYYNERLLSEMRKRKEYTESRRNNLKGGKKDKNNDYMDYHMATHMDNHMDTHMENENISINNNTYLYSDLSIKDNKYKDIVDYLNNRSGKNFRVSAQTKKLIDARLNENFIIDDFYRVIDNQCEKWLSDEKMIDYLRPQTLFSNKFESYLNTIKKKKFNIMDL